MKRLCKDCRHAKAKFLDKLWQGSFAYKCQLPTNYVEGQLNPVTGRTTKGYYQTCSVARVDHNICGSRGANWLPRDTRQHLFTMISDET